MVYLGPTIEEQVDTQLRNMEIKEVNKVVETVIGKNLKKDAIHIKKAIERLKYLEKSSRYNSVSKQIQKLIEQLESLLDNAEGDIALVNAPTN